MNDQPNDGLLIHQWYLDGMNTAFESHNIAEARRYGQLLWNIFYANQELNTNHLNVLRMLSRVLFYSGPKELEQEVTCIQNNILLSAIDFNLGVEEPREARTDFRRTVKIIEIDFEDVKTYNPIIKQERCNENIIVIKNFLVPNVDYGIFNKFNAVTSDEPTVSSKVKKGVHEDMVDGSLMSCVVENKSLAQEVQKNALELERFVKNWFNLQVPHTGERSSYTTWRFMQTGTEAYHLDNYRGDLLRGFLNLDHKGRMWGWGHKRSELTKKISLPDGNIGKQNDYLNPVMNMQERDTHEFEQFTFWMCDSRRVAHQIQGGNKMAAFTYHDNGMS